MAWTWVCGVDPLAFKDKSVNAKKGVYKDNDVLQFAYKSEDACVDIPKLKSVNVSATVLNSYKCDQYIFVIRTAKHRLTLEFFPSRNSCDVMVDSKIKIAHISTASISENTTYQLQVKSGLGNGRIAVYINGTKVGEYTGDVMDGELIEKVSFADPYSDYCVCFTDIIISESPIPHSAKVEVTTNDLIVESDWIKCADGSYQTDKVGASLKVDYDKSKVADGKMVAYAAPIVSISGDGDIKTINVKNNNVDFDINAYDIASMGYIDGETTFTTKE